MILSHKIVDDYALAPPLDPTTAVIHRHFPVLIFIVQNKALPSKKHVFDGLTVMISACHVTNRGRSGFDSPSESNIYEFMSLSIAQIPDSLFIPF
jgi:hypothetical protein